MFNILIFLSVVLVLAILFLLFRTQVLINVAKGTYNKRATSLNKINAFLFPVFFVLGFGLFFWYSDVASDFYLPESASEHGLVTDKWFWFSILVICIPFLATHVLLFMFPYMYQYKEDRKAEYFAHNNRLEVIWTIIPAIVLTILVISGWKTWSDITQPAPEDSEVVEVMGKQFAWQVRYAGKDKVLGKYNFREIDAANEFGMDFTDRASFDDFVPREIHVPKGRPVLFNIRARDVLHSVFAPHFRLKMDAVPGMPTKFWFTPRITTAEMREKLNNPDFNYELACTEVCGRGHFAMKFLIVVDEEEDYKKWYDSQESWLKQNPDYLKNKIAAGVVSSELASVNTIQ